ncbi:YggS family pyridoxal phosphate-dependent enzyme [Thalassotalea aquiviva]|uniref:YggS family pyridoxal phosphate-dependent enzyme n=1 Tax=Thalassotalea aquiviva TaxID=3242415 RepID=UPI00352ABFCA
MMNIAQNLSRIHAQIESACNIANRPLGSVNLLAVSKTKPIELITQAYAAGQRHFGENYIQEAVEKAQQLAHLNDICWHFIGPIQSNKTKLIAEHMDWVHSIDREKIAKRLNDQRNHNITPLNVCLQVNISGEESKSGVDIDQLDELAEFVATCPHLVLRGLMAIPAKGCDQTTRDNFNQMATLFQRLKRVYPSMDTLSMGMSNDLDLAIECGSTMIRVGTAIFGTRD